jgi:glutathione S-transferase
MKLYYSPGACSLSPHIALREAGLPFELVQVDLKAKKTKSGDDFSLINPKGYVPALQLDDGSLLTEGAVLVQYIADLNPDARLAPRAGTLERYRLQEWLHFIATELQKTFGTINNPKSSPELRRAFAERVKVRFSFVADRVGQRDYLLDENYTVADGYAYYTLRSLRKLDQAWLEASSALFGYVKRIEARPAVRAALAAEGVAAIGD